MGHPKAAKWLEISTTSSEALLSEYATLRQLASSLSSTTQFPSMISFIGEDFKHKLIKLLLGDQSIDCQVTSGVYLYQDPGSGSSEAPLFYAECNLERPDLLPDHEAPFRRPLLWCSPDMTRREIVAQVYSRIIAPFSDIMCYVIEGSDNITTSYQQLVSLISSCKSAVVPGVLPRTIVLCNQSEAFSEEQLERYFFEKLISEYPEDRTLLCSLRERVSFILLPKGSHTDTKGFQRLRMTISRELGKAREERDFSRTLFNSQNFLFLMEVVHKHFALTISQPADLIRATSIHRPAPTFLQANISELLKHVPRCDQMIDFAAPVVASSLVLNYCTQGVHMFQGQIIFEILYKNHCLAAFDKHLRVQGVRGGESKRRAFIEAVCKGFHEGILTLEDQSILPKAMHIQTHKGFRKRWRRISSNITCFWCLFNKPEHALECGHSFCDDCLRIFGQTNQANWDYTFKITVCALCSNQTNQDFAIKPPTAGMRILTLDGGGIRGIIELELLRLLEERLGLGLPIIRAFDMVVGTSTGGLIALGLGVKGWSVEACTENFEKLVPQAFKPRNLGPFSAVGQFRRILVSCLTGSLYDTPAFEAALKEVFGAKHELFGHGALKTAISATSSNSFPCILTNYNGTGVRRGDCGYGHLEGKILTYEAARGTSAAPLYHTTITLPSIRVHSEDTQSSITLQDGGLGGQNNPIAIASWESRIVDPTISNPDIILSLGTGHDMKNQKCDKGQTGKSWITRLVEYFNRSLDCQKAWHEYLNQADRREIHHRLTLEFNNNQPALDEAHRMPELKLLTRKLYSASAEIEEVVGSLIARFFYFELVAIPKYSMGQLECSGVIRCRLEGGSPPLQQLICQLRNQAAEFLIKGRPQNCTTPEIISKIRGGETYGVGVAFSVLNADEMFSIALRFGNKSRDISAFPCSISWLKEQQHRHHALSGYNLSVGTKRKSGEEFHRFRKRRATNKTREKGGK